MTDSKPYLNIALSIANHFKCCVNSSTNTDNIHHNNLANNNNQEANNIDKIDDKIEEISDNSIDIIIEKTESTHITSEATQ